jgi:methionyl-tRNA formyltransferase
MTRVLIVGNGQAAASALKVAAAHTGLEIRALLTSDGPRSAGGGPERLPERMIRDLPALRERGLQDVDWLLIANSTVLVPAEVLDQFEGQALNLHPGLLPEYAGLHTHQWAIRNGEESFGATIHRVVTRVDAGAIVAQSRFPIAPEDTGLTLFRKCMKSGQELLRGVLEDIAAGRPLAERPQDLSRRRNYRHADATDDRIDWTWTARQVRDFVRAGDYGMFRSPTYTAALHGLAAEPVLVLAAEVTTARGGAPGSLLGLTPEGPVVATGQGAVTLTRATLNGKPLAFGDWQALLGARDSIAVRG